MFTVLWCYLRNSAFKQGDTDYHLSADLTGQANHLGVTIEADIIKQKQPENNGGYNALKFGKTDPLVYSQLTTDHPIDLTRWQVVNCYAGRIPLINSGGESKGADDLAQAVRTAVINKRAGGIGPHRRAQGLPAPDRRGRGADPRHPGRLPRPVGHHRLTDRRPARRGPAIGPSRTVDSREDAVRHVPAPMERRYSRPTPRRSPAIGRGRAARRGARCPTPRPNPKSHELLDRVVIRFAGDSGDGMQLAGDRFTTTSALLGNDLATFPDFPAEIRAPAGTLAGVSAFQVHISDHDISTPGDSPNVLVAMNPAALKANIDAPSEGRHDHRQRRRVRGAQPGKGRLRRQPAERRHPRRPTPSTRSR